MVSTHRSFLKFLQLLLLFVTSATALGLIPISHPDYIHNAAAIPRRQESLTGELDLQDFKTFYWGAPGDLTIHIHMHPLVPRGRKQYDLCQSHSLLSEQYERLIAMERFADQLKSVQCAEEMMLEFKDDATFEYAKDVWNWVNQDVNHTVIIVTNYEGCADNMERLPFVVSNIKYDEAANKAFLTADLKDWEEVAHSHTLNIGHTPLTPAHRMLMSRGVFPRDTEFSMSLTSGFDQNLFFATQDTIVSIPINGIEIAKVVKIGAFLDIDVGFAMQEWEGAATANLGARMEWSNAAVVKIDLVNSANNKFSGWTPT
ncbi:hypothetical protein EK21DRAFT_86738 [Setomelanomma holmii]|uniref:Uncharacterized protein n=1 Tax=Setomelanomma holmii TaxID=210430 RepID=A0A9P4LQR5_9PLEO|nr:hypothetical protein EK21DRAFT_86738 [Setomelanomma holmii]